MEKQNAVNLIKFLDRVEVKGHTEREAMNACIEDIMVIVNAEELQEKMEKDAEADAE